MTLEQLCEVLRKYQPKSWKVFIDTRYDERFLAMVLMLFYTCGLVKCGLLNATMNVQ